MSEEERRTSQASDARSGQQQVRCWNELAKASRPSTEGGREVDFKTPYPHITPALTPKKHPEAHRKKKEADRTRGTTAEVLKVEEEVVGKKLLNFSAFKWPHHPSQSLPACLPPSAAALTEQPLTKPSVREGASSSSSPVCCRTRSSVVVVVVAASEAGPL